MTKRHEIVGEILSHHLGETNTLLEDINRLVTYVNLPTHFSEANAFLAMTEGEREEATKILEGFTHKELAKLSIAAQDLADLCDELRGHVRVLS